MAEMRGAGGSHKKEIHGKIKIIIIKLFALYIFLLSSCATAIMNALGASPYRREVPIEIRGLGRAGF